jgi:hypothetical protein
MMLPRRSPRLVKTSSRLVTRFEDFKLIDEGAPVNLWPGRHVWGNGSDVRRGNAVVDIVAICENFATNRILQVCPGLDDHDVFNWTKRQKAWLDELGVDFANLGTHWPSVEGFVEVRNALQHGLGRLTDSQLSAKRRGAVLGAIAAAGVELNGDRVVLTSTDVASCARACRSFILQLDHAARAPS